MSRAEALRIYVQHIRLGEVDSDLIGKYAAAAERFPTELRAAERELFDGPLGYSVKKHLHAVLPRTRELVRKEGA